MSVACLAFAGWLIAYDKRHFTVTGRQWLMMILLAYASLTTLRADLYADALFKWEWVWKAMALAIFLPLTLRTRLRIESYLLFMILSAGAIVIVGGIKTMLSGGGYGALNLMVDNNSGLYEGSTNATEAIAIIPVILWLARFGSVDRKSTRLKSSH